MRTSGRKTVLLVNPWICDLAAYDLWMQPLGLLHIAGKFSAAPIEFHLLDLLCRDGAAVETADRSLTARYGTGRFHRQVLPQPEALRGIRRRFSRYGIPPESARARLGTLSPHLIMVTSGMTYWYPGVQQTIAWLRTQFAGCPIVLGGIYATLVPDHARACSGADEVIAGGRWEDIGRVLSRFLHCEIESPGFESWPAVSLLRGTKTIVFQATRGCPFRCTYCAAHLLSSEFHPGNPEALFSFLSRCVHEYRSEDFVFYDDAVLYRTEEFMKPFLRRVVQAGLPVRFHFPNGLHVRYIDEELSGLFFQAGVKTIRLALESSGPSIQQKSGGKVSNAQLSAAVIRLKAAGFAKSQIGVYTLLGIPGQTVAQIQNDIEFVHGLGALSLLSSYSLVPGTDEWIAAVRDGLITAETDLLQLSHSAFPLLFGGFTAQDISSLRQQAAALNRNDR